MAILSISATDGNLRHPPMPDIDMRLPLARAIAALPPGQPIVVMVHGYSHHPLLKSADPHRHIYASRAVEGHTSWPHALGFGTSHHGSGLCIPFSWPGRMEQGLHLNPRGFARIYERSAVAGRDLGRFLRCIADIAPGRRVNILAHSLGARVALRALADCPERVVDRVLLLGAAAFSSETRAILHRAPAARAARICNVTARENDVFDLGFERLAPMPRAGDHSLGRGLGACSANWLDLQLDHPDTHAALARHGIALGRPPSAITHRGFYTRPGAMAFYRQLICAADPICFARLRADLGGIEAQPRGSTLGSTLGRSLARALRTTFALPRPARLQ